MKILLVLAVLFGCALVLYLFILFLKKATNDFNKLKFKKKDRTSLTYKLGGGIK